MGLFYRVLPRKNLIRVKLLQLAAVMCPATGQRIPLEIKVGDKVVYGKHAGIEVKFDEEELVLLTENDVLVVLE